MNNNNNETISDIFSDIASSIRTKTGKDNLITASEMSEEIESIPTSVVDRLLMQPGATYKYDESTLLVFKSFVQEGGNNTIIIYLINFTNEDKPTLDTSMYIKDSNGNTIATLVAYTSRYVGLNTINSSTMRDLSSAAYITF